MEPFYFKSYDRIVGSAETPRELLNEMKRLENEDPSCVEYHVREGHISTWLKETGRENLFMKIENIKDPKSVIDILETEVMKEGHHAQHGRGSGGQHSPGKRSTSQKRNH